MRETSTTPPDLDHKHPLCIKRHLANDKLVKILLSNFAIMAQAKRHRTGSDLTADRPERRRAGRRGGIPDNRRGRGRGSAPPCGRGGYGDCSPWGTTG